MILYVNPNNVMRNSLKEKWTPNDESISFRVKSWHFGFPKGEFRESEQGEESLRHVSMLSEKRENQVKSCQWRRGNTGDMEIILGNQLL